MYQAGKRFAGLLMGILLTVLLAQPVMAAESAMYSSENANVNVAISFSEDVATCTVKIYGSSGIEKISGTLVLFDDTSNYPVSTWAVLVNGGTYSSSNSAVVSAGHQYTLRFSGTVYLSDGTTETVTTSVTKTNG